jgi:tetratricopeptide (TPR) repeat protein
VAKPTKHLSRQELKTNQFQEALSHSAEAVLSHKMTLVYVVIAALLVGGGIFGWRFYAQRQSVKAEAAFSDAMQTYQAVVVGPGQPPQPNEISYSDESKKYQDALKKFHAVAKEYPRTHPGELAQYYSALCEEHLGQNAQAISLLTHLGKGSDHDFAAMARFELAEIYDETGKSQQAVQLYNELLQNPSVLVPRPMVLLALAAHYQQSNPAQAVKLYQQIKTDYPDTTAADQADQQLALLPSGKS